MTQIQLLCVVTFMKAQEDPHMIRSLVIAAAATGLGIPSTADACSRYGFHPSFRSASTAHFIATATGDTIVAGPGAVKYVVAPCHSGPAGDRTVFGQVVSVRRIGGLAPRRAGVSYDRVVLVPWDYGPDCRPTPWMRSTVWVSAGTEGLFTAALRDSAHWAGGIPTYDVFAPEFQPYPQQVGRQRRIRSQDATVPMDELFDLMELFPEDRLLRDSADVAVEPLFRWARENPALTQRYPIANVLAGARALVRSQRVRAINSPLTGTWRLTASLAGAPARTFYIRTEQRPTSHWDSTSATPRVEDPTFVPRVYGYYLQAAISQSIDSLPTSCFERRRFDRHGYISVLNAPPQRMVDTLFWTGELEAKIPERAFLGDTALGAFSRDAFNAYYRRSREGLSPERPARFVQAPDGTLRVEQVQTLESGQSLTLSGTRISRDVVACR